ncbi:hypothetical protein SO694_00018438 [Aureococcus anophagefferens]|uniref:Uncharacterized protein n=1 Tax=Aureococcus anophagefferens TaxID=44056 RepID=A0ABR1G114_AURAN
MSSRDGLLALGAGVAGGLVALAAQKLLRRESTIARFGMPNPRAAAAVVHNGTVYLSGQAKLLSTQIWVKTMGEHFAPMNEVWNAYVAEIPDCKGVRAASRRACDARWSRVTALNASADQTLPTPAS